MQLSGSVIIKAPRQQVWDYLTDALKVSQCAPGVESVELMEGGKKFKAVAAIGFGSVKAKFVGDAEWLALDPPNRATIKAHGAAPGSAADVLAEMVITDAPDGGTQMSWTAEVTVLGQLASLAARMMTPISQKLSEQFFVCVKQKIEAPPAPPPPVSTPPPAASPAA